MEPDEQSRQPVGESAAVDDIRALMHQLLTACERAPPQARVTALLGTVLATAAGMPHERSAIAQQLRENLTLLESMGAADADQAGAILRAESAVRQQLQAMQAPPAVPVH